MFKKICIVIGSRANYSSIKSLMSYLRDDPDLKLQIVLFNSSLLDKYGDVSKLIEGDRFRVDFKIFNLLEGETPLTMAKSTGLALLELPSCLEKLNPDLVFTVGDRFECISIALAASYMNIPVAHTMGGEVTGTIDESIRHAITKLSHVHFAASEGAKKRIILLGEDQRYVFNVGCPRMDTVEKVLSQKFSLPNKFVNSIGVGDKLDLNNPYVILSQHPVTTEFKDSDKQMEISLNVLSKLDIQKIVLWPNADAGSSKTARVIRKFRESKKQTKIRFFKNLPLDVYIKVLSTTKCILGNSSSGVREGNYMGVPCVNIGTRQQGREKGSNVISVNFEKNEILEAINKQIMIGKYKKGNIYGDGNSAKKIIKILKRLKNINIQKQISY